MLTMKMMLNKYHFDHVDAQFSVCVCANISYFIIKNLEKYVVVDWGETGKNVVNTEGPFINISIIS